MATGNQQSRTKCDFSCSERYCELLDKAGVPHDEKWRTLILYMRNIAHHDYLTESQKKEIQEILLHIIKDKRFADEDYRAVLAKKRKILNEPYQKKIDDTIHETSRFLNEVTELILRRKGDVQKLEFFAVESIQNEKEPKELIVKLRMAFHEVTTAMEQDAVKLVHMSITDGLTGLNNRRALDEYLARTLPDAREKKTPLSFILLDVDHFKKFNDTHGHRIGDQALAAVAKVITQCIDNIKTEKKVECYPARYGGEEFAVVMPGIDGDGAVAVAEFIREKIEGYNFVIRDADGRITKDNIRITASLGVSSFQSGWMNIVEKLVEEADKALYLAKSRGRNKVCASFAEP